MTVCIKMMEASKNGLKMPLLFLLVLVLSCKKPKDLSLVNIDQVNMTTGVNAMPQIKFVAHVTNPNDYSLVVKKMSCSVAVEGVLIGNCSLDTTTFFQKKSTSSVPLTVQINNAEIASYFVGWYFKQELDVKIEGSARFGRSGFYFTKPFIYSAKQKNPFR